MLWGSRVSSRKREQGQLGRDGYSGRGDEIGTGNLQVGTRLALGLLGRYVPETGTLIGTVEERAELEVMGATGVDHTVS